MHSRIAKRTASERPRCPPCAWIASSITRSSSVNRIDVCVAVAMYPSVYGTGASRASPFFGALAAPANRGAEPIGCTDQIICLVGARSPPSTEAMNTAVQLIRSSVQLPLAARPEPKKAWCSCRGHPHDCNRFGRRNSCCDHRNDCARAGRAKNASRQHRRQRRRCSLRPPNRHQEGDACGHEIGGADDVDSPCFLGARADRAQDPAGFSLWVWPIPTPPGARALSCDQWNQGKNTHERASRLATAMFLVTTGNLHGDERRAGITRLVRTHYGPGPH